MNFDKNSSKIDFIKHRKKFHIMSIVTVLAGVILLSTLGLNLGIHFSSGTQIDVLSDSPISTEEVTEQFEEIGLSPDQVLLAGDTNEIARASFTDGLNQEETIMLQQHFEEMYNQEPAVGTVSAMVGEELARNAIISVLIATVGIIIYVSIRFEFLYGISAIIALFYDALFILFVFSVLQLEVNIPFIAAVLTIVGYSINDTIVTFDRIRENYNKQKRIKTFEDLADIVNQSLIQTLSRSINTVLTVVFAAGALLIFGGENLRVFSLALVVGLVAGTYSSLFIASQIWLELKWRSLKKQKTRKLDNDKQQDAVPVSE